MTPGFTNHQPQETYTQDQYIVGLRLLKRPVCASFDHGTERFESFPERERDIKRPDDEERECVDQKWTQKPSPRPPGFLAECADRERESNELNTPRSSLYE